VSKVITARQAVDLLKDGVTFCTSGFMGFGVPETLLSTMEEKFIKEGHPKDLFIVFAAGIAGDGKSRGGNHFSQPGMLRRLFSGNNSMTPKLSEAIASNRFPAYMAPQGVMVHLFRAIAGGKPGVLTHVGLKTFCDPRVEGCRVNDKCKSDPTGCVVELIELAGQELLFYPAFPIDICFIKGTTVDEFGNLSIEHEAVKIEQFEIAAATKNSGGIVIVEAERLVQRGTIAPSQVTVPGALVNHIVIADPDISRQHFYPDEAPYVPSWTGETRIPLAGMVPLPLNIRKICGRRALFELKPGGFTNLGVGMPTTVSAVANEEGLADQVVLSIESGTIGGVPAGGLATGASYNPEAIIKQSDLFDLYDGGGIDVCYLGLAEADEQGNINVSKFSGRVTGPGGFINIAQNAKKVCFMGTFTTGKSKYEIKYGKLKVLEEAGGIKFRKHVEQITFSGEYSCKKGSQQVLYITERAVFRLTPQGMMLTEIAPGMDLEKDILAYMEFIPLIADDLKEMDLRIFNDERMGLTLEDLC